MKRNLGNVFVIAQKEFADNLYSMRFLALLSIVTLIIFSMSYRNVTEGRNMFEIGFLGVAQIIGLFLPLLGIALGFDTIVKERKSGSLNVLLTHPIFRDNIITGKIIGSLATLALVVGIAVIASVGTMLFGTGVQVSLFQLERILIFAILTFLYISIFVGIGIFLSIVSKSASNSLIYGIAIWLNVVVAFGAIIAVIASMITGQPFLDFDNPTLELNAKMQKFTPLHHYAETVSGVPSFSWGGISIQSSKLSSGIFDTGNSLDKWIQEYWSNLIVLITLPIILFIASFVAFLRKDITL
ncbi:putative ABC transporter permease protein NosY [Methanosarcinales archaeon]|uniref:ABC transporter permease n=1 Tax=Candidatus Methanoperedens sp. BLZ2 TaxID=2035255 RepID=UPI000BE30008|nr:ABC transporter permease subunit [Candidatus Methanoperedens sp. BLZ2]KAB2945759.1 MAG: ABC transporter permease [Candidatus Methanoperedens sp.]MBZ0177426.1 ABC transporter permease [Candidatus Methanoperedens nitroreducens]CAG0992341.1 putative ABC transporter permease protein NosY [Methanosarcinales archaeon]MCX9079811.1 ABC transporter permease subunit [Candidatus Methanoperedens sp.]MCX9085962.1 ABC transporter permease subunit [Candidatus Methanoperedens sp.]